MSVKSTLNDGFTTIKLSWVKETIFLVTFSLLVGIILLPFAFLVAVASVGIEEDVSNPIDLGVFFWISVGLLFLVANIFVLMIIGMIQKIGRDNQTGSMDDIESLVKYPFQHGRFSSFFLLSLYTSIVMGVVGGAFAGITWLLDLNSSDLWFVDIVYGVIQIIVFILLMPPIIFASKQIIIDTSRFDAFTNGWRKYIEKFKDLSFVNFLAFLPMIVIIAAISFLGVVISWVGDASEALELLYVLGISFIIIIISLLMVFIVLPYYIITVGGQDEVKTTTIQN